MKRPGALALLVGILLLAGCAKSTAVDAPGSATPAVVVTKTITVTVQPTAAPVSSPAPATGLAPAKGEWATVACGTYNTLAIKQDGALWAWGLNDYGQLGQGTIDSRAHAAPTQVGHAHDWVTVSCGYGDGFAVKRDGTLWAWGNNCDMGGNLGLGPYDWRTTSGAWFDEWSPTRVGHASDWTAVHYGYFHGLALKKDGTLWGWGGNFYGALGTGKATFRWAPAKVGHGRNWTAAVGGGDFSLALKKDGTLWASGANVWGNLGLGDTANRRSPTKVGSAHDWAAVSAGIGYSLATRRDGTLWAWGDNTFGELGLGDTSERHAPTQVGNAHDWAAVACLGHHSLALKRDGTLWAWGENCYGQLGVGDTTDRHSPTQVGASRDWAAIAPGAADSYHTVALKRDGTLWAWGFNRFGQLGLGDSTDRHVPTQVGTR
jgi:alpha-tubulin suppressor-like RCC1 family protein